LGDQPRDSAESHDFHHRLLMALLLIPAVDTPEECTMATTMDRTCPRAPGRWHAFLLAAALPLFLGALLCDCTYWSSYESQWSNFASWLMAGGLVFAGVALVCALVDLFRAERRGGRTLAYFVLLLAVFVLGFVNSLVHARDAYGVMPSGLVLSAVVLVLAGAATWLACSHQACSHQAFAGWRAGEGR
jgi:uncharacterized membrane protein